MLTFDIYGHTWKMSSFQIRRPFQEATLGVQRFRLAAAGQELSVSLGGRRHRLVFLGVQPRGLGALNVVTLLGLDVLKKRIEG